MSASKPHSVWDDFGRVRSALGPRVPIKHSSYLERVSNETLDALQRIEEQFDALKRQADLDAERAAILSSAVGRARLILGDASKETTALIDAALASNPASSPLEDNEDPMWESGDATAAGYNQERTPDASKPSDTSPASQSHHIHRDGEEGPNGESSPAKRDADA